MKPIPSYEMMNPDSPKEPTSRGDYENVAQPRPVSMTSNPAYTIPWITALQFVIYGLLYCIIYTTVDAPLH